MKKKVIDLQGSVDEEMVDYVRCALLYFVTVGNPDITVRVQSTGGCVQSGLDIYHCLVHYPGFVTGSIDGFCNSMASVILQACDHRVITPSGTMHPHNVRFHPDDIDIELLDPATRALMPAPIVAKHEKDLKEIPKQHREGLTLLPVARVEDVFALALQK